MRNNYFVINKIISVILKNVTGVLLLKISSILGDIFEYGKI